MLSVILLLLVVYTVVPVSSELHCGCSNGHREIHVTASFRTNQHKHNGDCYVSWNRLLSDSFAYCESTQVILHQGSYNVSRNINKDLTWMTDNLDISGEPTAIINCTKYPFIFKISRALTSAYEIRISNLHFQNCREILIETTLKKASIKILNSSLTRSCLKIHRKKHFGKTDIVFQNSIVNCSKCTDAIVVLSSKREINSESSITLHDVTVSDNKSPFVVSKFNRNITKICIQVRGSVNFTQNKDFTIQTENSKLLFMGAKVNFTGNKFIDDQGATVNAKKSMIMFEDCVVVFNQNEGSSCGGIMASEKTRVIFKDNVTVNFSNNSGSNGGALALYTDSFLIFNATKSNITINFTSNKAQFGGLLYVEDRWYGEVRSVFDLQGDITRVKVWFRNNSALLEGNQIYGGWIDWLTNTDQHIKDIVHINQDNDVASDPIRICLCIEDERNCSVTQDYVTMHGRALILNLVAVGQRSTPVVSYVESILENFDVFPITILQKNCTKVKYEIDSRFQEGNLLLKPYPDNTKILKYTTVSHRQPFFKPLSIHLQIKNCTLGFEQKGDNYECVCLSSLTLIGMRCDMQGYGYTIKKTNQQWVGVDHSTSLVVAYERCPLDYCLDNKSLVINLEKQDEQCAFKRSGILCGGCKANYSRVLGSTKCKKCSNLHLLMIIPCILAAGLLLVVLLIVLDITVSVGTINGLIFYANIIRTQQSVFFTSEITFFSTFIAWLNLDLGIESCLFDGLDSYTETWFQFLFPLYIWTIVVVIIVASHYSMRVSKLCGKNIVQVLATLFLLSYTKLLRLTIDVITYANIIYPKGNVEAVWAYDGNIGYFRGKHIPLFLATVLLELILAVLYPLSLVSIQCLLKISHYRGMFWIHTLKPLFDAYTGPYKDSHHYWTGLLLIIRIIILLIFTYTRSVELAHTLIVITVISFGMLTYFAGTRGIYKSNIPNCLEVFFLCNLGITSAAVLYERERERKRSIIPINISAGVSFAVFVGIIIFHTLQRFLRTTFGEKLKVKMADMRNNGTSNDVNLQALTVKITSSSVELKEPLLE